MDFAGLKGKNPDPDLPDRSHDLAWLRKALTGHLYDNLKHPFDREQTDGQEYVPVRERRPSVRYALCRLVVDDAVSMLFSESHFPAIECEDEPTQLALQELARQTHLNEIMIEAATTGAVGSVCIALRILKGRVFWDVMETEYLTPTWDPEEPDKLLKVTEKRKVHARQLKEQGYKISDEDSGSYFWFQRTWDDQAETWYKPWKVADSDHKPKVDPEATTEHALGFVPLLWIKNLPGGDKIDGRPTFPVEAIDDQIEIDYLLSQGGRALRYASDPTLLIKEPAIGESGELIRSAANAITVGEKGDAKLLEINGTSTAAVLDYVRAIRELAIESAHGNRSNADKISAAQSGRAMELLNQALVWLADRLRITYGERGLKELLQMVISASAKVEILDKEGAAVVIAKKTRVTLRWPHWYAPTAADKGNQATTLRTLKDAQLISQESALKALAPDYEIADVPAEAAQIAKEAAERAAALQAVQTKVKITE